MIELIVTTIHKFTAVSAMSLKNQAPSCLLGLTYTVSAHNSHILRDESRGQVLHCNEQSDSIREYTARLTAL